MIKLREQLRQYIPNYVNIFKKKDYSLRIMSVLSLSNKIIELLEQKGWSIYLAAESSNSVEGPVTCVHESIPYILLPVINGTFHDLCQRVTMDANEGVFPSIIPEKDPSSTLRIEHLVFHEQGLEFLYEERAGPEYTHVETSAVLEFLTQHLTDNFLLPAEFCEEIYDAFQTQNLKLTVDRDGVSHTIRKGEHLKAGRLYTPLPTRDNFSNEDYSHRLHEIIDQQSDVFAIGKKAESFHHLSFKLDGVYFHSGKSDAFFMIPYDDRFLIELRTLRYGTQKCIEEKTEPGNKIYPLVGTLANGAHCNC